MLLNHCPTDIREREVIVRRIYHGGFGEPAELALCIIRFSLGPRERRTERSLDKDIAIWIPVEKAFYVFILFSNLRLAGTGYVFRVLKISEAGFMLRYRNAGVEPALED
jgi:hypothetical protein